MTRTCGSLGGRPGFGRGDDRTARPDQRPRAAPASVRAFAGCRSREPPECHL